jgi:flagellar hook-associated protein 2
MASTSSISGLVSGIDTASIVKQLMDIEARPQTLLKSQLATAKTTARALREINTAMATLSSAAEALTGASAFTGRTASSNAKDVTAAATITAVPGSSVSFTVTGLASAQTSLSTATWSSRTGDVRTAAATNYTDPLPEWPLTLRSADGSKVIDTIDLPLGASLDDAAAAINNKKSLGLTATVVRLDADHYKLQVTSATTGTKNGFVLRGSGEAADATTPAFGTIAAARDAQLKIGNETAASPTNTFADLLTGVTVTVSQVNTAPTTVTVAADTASVADKFQAMVNAASAALATIAKYTDSGPGSTAPLKGNATLTGLATRILSQLSKAVGDTSPAAIGLQLNRDGTVEFDSGKLAALLKSDPSMAKKLVAGTVDLGADGVGGTADDTLGTDGLAARMYLLAKSASASATGMITTMADGQDARIKRMQTDVDNWDMRLEKRQQLLTSKFQAMESALGKLNSQSSWLSSQINSLYNPNAKK